ncbi:MAG: hypothetical protein JST22_05990 [Bacteroidetes bacterium]|nr:hypothetical protein [Bacteroidota bacterium]
MNPHAAFRAIAIAALFIVTPWAYDWLTFTNAHTAEARAIHESVTMQVDPRSPVRSSRIIRVLDADGTVVKELRTEDAGIAARSVAADISDLPRGVYRIEVTDERCLFSEEITKNIDPVPGMPGCAETPRGAGTHEVAPACTP